MHAHECMHACVMLSEDSTHTPDTLHCPLLLSTVLSVYINKVEYSSTAVIGKHYVLYTADSVHVHTIYVSDSVL